MVQKLEGTVSATSQTAEGEMKREKGDKYSIPLSQQPPLALAASLISSTE